MVRRGIVGQEVVQDRTTPCSSAGSTTTRGHQECQPRDAAIPARAGAGTGQTHETRGSWNLK